LWVARLCRAKYCNCNCSVPVLLLQSTLKFKYADKL
jgi:hypothetical protein